MFTPAARHARRPAVDGIAIVALLLAGPAGTLAQSPATRPINETCPVMTEEPVDPNITTVHDSLVIAFCCDKCLVKFRADPQRYLSRLPAAASTGQGAQAAATAGPGATASDTGASGTGRGAEDGEEPVPWLGRVHPVVVHFPIAGLLLALLGFVLHAATRRAEFAGADVVPLAVAGLSSVAAVITGNIAEDAMRFGPRLREIAERHEALSTTVMILSLGLLALRGWCWKGVHGPWRWVYGGGLLITCILVGATGYLGGSLVHGPEHLAW